MDTPETPSNSTPDVHQKIGLLTRQLHDALNQLGYADKLRGSAGELPDAQNRLSYIARLTGEAAEKVLGRVEQAKTQHEYIAAETKRVLDALVKDPVAAVAKGEVYNHLVDMERVTKEADEHLTEIMMAQDFHDLTGQVIARVVNLAATIEQQLVQLLIQTAPGGSSSIPAPEPKKEALQGPVVNGADNPEKVANTASMIRATAHNALDDLKHIVGVLRGTAAPGTAPSGHQGIDAVAELVQSARAAGIHATLFTDLRPGDVGTVSGHVAFRVVQESLTNAQKHAGDQTVRIHVAGADHDGIRVGVRNVLSTRPSTVPEGSRSGLPGLSEQVRNIGGTFDAGVRDGEFVVDCWLPWFA